MVIGACKVVYIPVSSIGSVKLEVLGSVRKRQELNNDIESAVGDCPKYDRDWNESDTSSSSMRTDLSQSCEQLEDFPTLKTRNLPRRLHVINDSDSEFDPSQTLKSHCSMQSTWRNLNRSIVQLHITDQSPAIIDKTNELLLVGANEVLYAIQTRFLQSEHHEFYIADRPSQAIKFEEFEKFMRDDRFTLK